MTNYYSLYFEHGFTVVKYLIALLTILGGILAMIEPLRAVPGPLGFVYGTRLGLLIGGTVLVVCGAVLLYGKIQRSKRWTGAGLMACYMCFLFGALVQGITFSWNPGAWAINALLALITGALFLRWRFKTAYIDPNHFKKEIKQLSK